MASTPRTPAPERPPPPVPAPATAPPPPPLETLPPPSPPSQAGEEYHTPPPSLDASPREHASPTLPSDGTRGGTPYKSPSRNASPREQASSPGDGRGAARAPAKRRSPDASPREHASLSSPGDGRGGTWAPGASPREQAIVPSDGRGGAGTPVKTPPHDASPWGKAGSPGDGREGARAPAKSPPLTPVRIPTPHLLPPPSSPSARQNGQERGAAATAPAHPPLRLAMGLLRTSSQCSLATKSPSSSPSPTPPSPLTPAAPTATNNNNNKKSGQSTPKHRGETWKSPAIPDPAEEAVTSPLRLGHKAQQQEFDGGHRQQRQAQHAAAAAEDGGAVPPDVAAVAAVGERRALSVTLRLATAALSLAAFSVIASARTSGWAGDSYARHQQYRYAVAVNVIVCAYSIAQSFGEIRRLISPRLIFRSMSSYYFSLFLDQVLAYLLMSASSAAASRNDLWVSRFGTDAFNRKISSALWLSFIGFLMLALNALISTANLFSMA